MKYTFHGGSMDGVITDTPCSPNYYVLTPSIYTLDDFDKSPQIYREVYQRSGDKYIFFKYDEV